MKININVNDHEHRLDVEPRETLLDILRERLRLTGAHAGCEHGVCGACTVLINGEPVRACLMLGVQLAVDDHITTVEGLAPRPGELSPVQDAFCEKHGTQCGYCTPAMVLTAQALLERNPDPSRDDITEAISANLCRCTGYGQIVEAIEYAATLISNERVPRKAQDE